MKNQHLQSLFIFTALDCEAKALINHFKLKKENAKHPFSIYVNNTMILTVTGVGKVAMAGGVAYVLGLFSRSQLPVLINIGIAGHKTHAIGSLLVASKIVDIDSAKVFYPQFIGAGWPETCSISTVALPNTQYNSDCLNDMEAASFYEMAVKFSSSELIHCLKLVSDNQSSSIDKINAKIVVEWIAKKVSEIETILEHIQRRRASILPVEVHEYNLMLNKWHFTVTEQVKLKLLLRRWQALSSNNWINEKDADCRSGKDILRHLEADVDCLEVNL